MIDFLKRIVSDAAVLYALFSSAIIGLLGGAAAGAHQFKHGGWSGVAKAMVIGIGVAVVVGLGVMDYVQSEALRFAIVGACAAIGEDVLEGLKAFGKAVRKDPLGAVQRVIAALRGQPHGGDGK